jgi:hypothetical protein
MNSWKKVSAWIFIVGMTLGFRVTPFRWDISDSDPTIWIKVCAENSATIEENDMKADDVLFGRSNLTFTQVLQSVIDDYNNAPTSFLRLALYPADPNNPGAPATGDSAFTVARASNRTIEICFGSTDVAAGLSGGYAMPKYEGRQIISCEIKAKPEHAKKVLFLTHLLSHEIGHCFSLMHPQEGTRAVMSYFGDKKTRLQRDDLAGLTFQYPSDASYAKETATLGLSGCAPRNQ